MDSLRINKDSPRKNRIFATILLGFGLLLLLTNGPSIWTSFCALNWPQTQGKIKVLKSRWKGNQLRGVWVFAPDLVYEYEARGVWNISHEVPLRFSRTPMPDQPVIVYYDPLDPKRSTLSRGVTISSLIVSAMSLVSVAIGSLFLMRNRGSEERKLK